MAFTPQQIADVYKQTVGSGTMSEADFVNAAMNQYGIGADTLMQAQSILLSPTISAPSNTTPTTYVQQGEEYIPLYDTPALVGGSTNNYTYSTNIGDTDTVYLNASPLNSIGSFTGGSGVITGSNANAGDGSVVGALNAVDTGTQVGSGAVDNTGVLNNAGFNTVTGDLGQSTDLTSNQGAGSVSDLTDTLYSLPSSTDLLGGVGTDLSTQVVDTGSSYTGQQDVFGDTSQTTDLFGETSQDVLGSADASSTVGALTQAADTASTVSGQGSATTGALTQAGSSTGQTLFTNLGDQDGWNITNAPDGGPSFNRGNQFVVSDEIYWNDKTPIGEELATRVAAVQNAGGEAGLTITPYALFDRVDAAGNVIRGVSPQTLIDEVVRSGVDFVALDPYLFGDNRYSAADGLEWTRQTAQILNDLGVKVKLVTQGFVPNNMTDEEIQQYNSALSRIPGVDEVVTFTYDFLSDAEKTAMRNLQDPYGLRSLTSLGALSQVG